VWVELCRPIIGKETTAPGAEETVTYRDQRFRFCPEAVIQQGAQAMPEVVHNGHRDRAIDPISRH